tara:strand:- start:408 stop:695 length:288 start_codon:yes stop_codon:yes gene_type:complete
MQWFHRSDIWLSLLLTVSILITSVFIIDSAYQTRQMYSELQELRSERDRLMIEWGRLMLERAAVSADMRIDGMARHSLSLGAASADRMVLMERSR